MPKPPEEEPLEVLPENRVALRLPRRDWSWLYSSYDLVFYAQDEQAEIQQVLLAIYTQERIKQANIFRLLKKITAGRTEDIPYADVEDVYNQWGTIWEDLEEAATYEDFEEVVRCLILVKALEHILTRAKRLPSESGITVREEIDLLRTGVLSGLNSLIRIMATEYPSDSQEQVTVPVQLITDMMKLVRISQLLNELVYKTDILSE